MRWNSPSRPSSIRHARRNVRDPHFAFCRILPSTSDRRQNGGSQSGWSERWGRAPLRTTVDRTRFWLRPPTRRWALTASHLVSELHIRDIGAGNPRLPIRASGLQERAADQNDPPRRGADIALGPFPAAMVPLVSLSTVRSLFAYDFNKPLQSVFPGSRPRCSFHPSCEQTT